MPSISFRGSNDNDLSREIGTHSLKPSDVRVRVAASNYGFAILIAWERDSSARS